MRKSCCCSNKIRSVKLLQEMVFVVSMQLWLEQLTVKDLSYMWTFYQSDGVYFTEFMCNDLCNELC